MKKIIITDRDKEIIQFLKDFKVATTTTISDLYFNSSVRPCQRRLKYLSEHGYIRSYQENVITEKIHYVRKKPINLKHALILSQFISKLKVNNINLLKYKVPYKLENIIADAFIAINVNGQNKIYFVEVENRKKFDLDKYEKLYYSRKWKDVFPVFPDIIVVSNKHVSKHTNFNIINIKLDLNNLEKLI
ncbi:replication-relaxation family protein [Romboutsia sp. Marseille-P6047]|uniref:replication-relaxation family protein n=1 Tax=Romboutsia sp. Marseille-P6047 TaxID=2161817 RepID=UPI000F0490A1|nr:replication-relaxation family protein [Romboutsia sp. Marseille-P6047]